MTLGSTPHDVALRVDALAKRYGSTVALDTMTWSARRGAVTAVLGPNGAGKSTTMLCAEGLLHADSGSVSVLGSDPWNATVEHRARVGVMLQDGGLPTGSKPVALLRHLARMYAEPAPVAELVRRLGIAEFSGRTVRRLSGGQKQRLALAVALVGAPEIAFLDEPTAGIDPHARLEVWDLLRELRDRGCAVVVTTHSFEEAGRIADHVVIVDAGRAVAAGPPGELAGGESLEDVYFALTRRGVS